MEGMDPTEFNFNENIELGNALFYLLIVYFVHRHYRDRHYAPARRYRFRIQLQTRRRIRTE